MISLLGCYHKSEIIKLIMDSFSTYAVTIRPRSGITDVQVDKFSKWVRKHCTYYYVITEKLEDQRHVHAALYLKVAKKRSNVTQMLLQLFKDLEPDEKSVLQKGVKILYSNDFLLNYMNKGDDTVVIERHLPEVSVLETFYPPKPIAPSTQRRLHMHATMEQYERLWRENVLPFVDVNTSTVRDFLFDMQYNKRCIGLLDDKKLMQHARWFTRWYHRAESCPSSFLPPFETEEGPGIHDTRRC